MRKKKAYERRGGNIKAWRALLFAQSHLSPPSKNHMINVDFVVDSQNLMTLFSPSYHQLLAPCQQTSRPPTRLNTDEALLKGPKRWFTAGTGRRRQTGSSRPSASSLGMFFKILFFLY
jgi:hypothetical protein